MNYSDYALICKALGDETRIKIVEMLKHGSFCACKILEEFNFTQPTLSYHMKILCDSKIVSGEKEGKWMHYKLNREVMEKLNLFLSVPQKIEKISCEK